MIHITKCFCPNNHVIMAFSWQEPSYTAETAVQHLQETVEELLKGAGPRPWCSVCKSREFHYQDEVAEQETVEAAVAPLIKRVLATVRLKIANFRNN